jgi:hypothetical protein
VNTNQQDRMLRDELIRALRSVDLPAGIKTRLPYGVLADVVMRMGRIDVVLADGRHLYDSTHCRHGRRDLCVDDSAGRRPAQCKGCAAPCRHTYEDDSEGTSTA